MSLYGFFSQPKYKDKLRLYVYPKNRAVFKRTALFPCPIELAIGLMYIILLKYYQSVAYRLFICNMP